MITDDAASADVGVQAADQGGHDRATTRRARSTRRTTAASRTPRPTSKIPTVGQFMMDMMVMALACDITAVISLQWTDTEAKHTFPWLNLLRAPSLLPARRRLPAHRVRADRHLVLADAPLPAAEDAGGGHGRALAARRERGLLRHRARGPAHRTARTTCRSCSRAATADAADRPLDQVRRACRTTSCSRRS